VWLRSSSSYKSELTEWVVLILQVLCPCSRSRKRQEFVSLALLRIAGAGENALICAWYKSFAINGLFSRDFWNIPFRRVGQKTPYWIPGSYVTSNSMSAGSNALPRLRTLCTNSKKPKYSGSFSWEIPRCGRSQLRKSDQLQSMDGSLPPPLLQNRACHFYGTRLLSDAPFVVRHPPSC
jgi:hypothetical protein